MPPLSRRSNCLAVIAALALASWSHAAQRPPNVIILMPDQMRGQAMSIAGDRQLITPNLERLARNGVYLPNTFANTPVCSPARATILTGQYPHRHGLIINDLRLRESALTIAEILSEAGYATGFVGKWHLDGGVRQPGFVPPGPRRQGFQFWAASECDHRHFDGHYFKDTDQPIPITKFEPQVWTDEAIEFIRTNRDRPFFLWWTCGPPHDPYIAPPEYLRLYEPAALVMRPNWKHVDRHGSRDAIAHYYAMITAVDEQIGRLLDLLDELSIAENTIVLFTSDHGDMLGSHEAILKVKPYEESIRVPGIIRLSGSRGRGGVSPLMFSHVDIAPTLLSFCGIRPPRDMQGLNQMEALLSVPNPGKAPRPRPTQFEADWHRPSSSPEHGSVYLQIYEPRPQEGVPGGWRGIRTERHLYARLKDKPWMLFDLARDPYQLNNLAEDPAEAELRGKLDLMLRERMAATGDDWKINQTEQLLLLRGPAVYDPKDANAGPAPK